MEDPKKYKELKERFNKIKTLRKKGKTLQEIGDIYKVSRERIRQILVSQPMIKIRECSLCGETFSGFNLGSQRLCFKCLSLIKGKEGRDVTRFLVRFRDKFTCQDCGLVRTDEDVKKHNSSISGLKGKIKSLDVHHLEGLCGKKTKDYDQIKDIYKLITLCHKCHYNRPEHGSKRLKVNK